MPAASRFSVCFEDRIYPPEFFAAESERLDQCAGSGGSVALHAPDSPWWCAAVLWARDRGRAIAILPPELPVLEAKEWAAQSGCQAILAHGGGQGANWTRHGDLGSFRLSEEPAPGSVTLFTSGSTGNPKRILHTWASLEASVTVREDIANTRWMSVYPLSRFAGFNTFLHSVLNLGSFCIPAGRDTAALAVALERWCPAQISATPTLWRGLLMLLPGSGPYVDAIRQIALGGEIVDQPVLDALRARFPDARITHVYASTEMGVCLSVSDGRAGFPAAWLDREDRAVRLSVRDGELWVRRSGPVSDAVGGDDWWATGDLVEIRGERVYFLGREGDILNIGGSKIAASVIEECLLSIGGVMGARVFGRASSVAGTVVAVDIVLMPGADARAARVAIHRHCRERLPAYAVPRLVQFVDALPVSESGKLRKGDV